MFKLFKPTDKYKELKELRKKCLEHHLPDGIEQNLSTPLPDSNARIQEISFLVVDFETTGFEPEESDIISIGWIEINAMQIDLTTQQHLYINNEQHINHETAVINHIVPQMVREGINLDEAVERLLDASAGKVMIAHGTMIEESFLNHYAKTRLNIPELPLVWLDTLRIEKWKSLEKGQQFKQDNRLSSAREKYNLPAYSTHNALIDSVATAELFLAQVAHIYRERKSPFEHIYKISR